MTTARSVAVFCGASLGRDPAWAEAARALGTGLAARGHTLVYGGGKVGLMGEVANAAAAAGGRVVGVIPEFLRRAEHAHTGIAVLEVTQSMHTRKQRMFDLADVFVSFAGGLGTLDETFEILTWRQLGMHEKPIVVCDIAGSGQALMGAIEAAIEMGFAKAELREMVTIVRSVSDLLDWLG